MENEQQPTQYNYQEPPKKKGISIGAALILGISGIIIAAIIAGAIIFASGAKTVKDINLDGFEVQIDENGGQTTINVGVDVQDEAVQPPIAKKIQDDYFRNYAVDWPVWVGEPPLVSKTMEVVDLLFLDTLDYYPEQKEFAESAGEIFENFEAGDALDGRLAASQYTKWCIANSLIQGAELSIVERCTTNINYPTNVDWTNKTDDILAATQIAPLYFGGVKQHFSGELEKAKYYLQQVVSHYEAGKSDWNREPGSTYFEDVAGQTYIDMVNHAQDILDTLS